jgi:hypothetical protein
MIMNGVYYLRYPGKEKKLLKIWISLASVYFIGVYSWALVTTNMQGVNVPLLLKNGTLTIIGLSLIGIALFFETLVDYFRK